MSLHAPAAIVTAVSDFDVDRARAIATEVGARQLHDDPVDLINDPEVDGILIASPDETHARLVSECLKAGKRVLCEKPLAPTPEECSALLAMEIETGRRMIDVGFMRRFDAGYNELRAVIRSGELGEALMFHCVHRNPGTPPGWTSDMQITAAAVHEIDILRWLTQSEITKVQVIVPRPRTPANRPGLAPKDKGGCLVGRHMAALYSRTCAQSVTDQLEFAARAKAGNAGPRRVVLALTRDLSIQDPMSRGPIEDRSGLYEGGNEGGDGDGDEGGDENWRIG